MSTGGRTKRKIYDEIATSAYKNGSAGSTLCERIVGLRRFACFTAVVHLAAVRASIRGLFTALNAEPIERRPDLVRVCDGFAHDGVEGFIRDLVDADGSSGEQVSDETSLVLSSNNWCDGGIGDCQCIAYIRVRKIVAMSDGSVE